MRLTDRLVPLLLLVGGRVVAGAGAWVAPDLTWRAAGLGQLPDGGSSAVVSRLFGVRDLALAGAAAVSPPEVRRAALLAGIVIDSIDAVSGFLGVRGGAPRGAWVGLRYEWE